MMKYDIGGCGAHIWGGLTWGGASWGGTGFGINT